MRFNWSIEKKNPMFYFILSFLLGMVIGGWGWDKYESTIPSRTAFSVPMMVVGGIMVVGGLIGMFTYKRKPKQ